MLAHGGGLGSGHLPRPRKEEVSGCADILPELLPPGFGFSCCLRFFSLSVGGGGELSTWSLGGLGPARCSFWSGGKMTASWFGLGHPGGRAPDM